MTVDVSNFDEVEAAAQRFESELGPIEVWINDAMTTVFAPVAEVSPDDFRRAIEVTFLGQVWGTKVALSMMRPRDRGSVVNVGSALAFIGIPLQGAYCASKFACRGFFQSTRTELIHDGSKVRLSMVHLPAVNTPQFEWCETTFSRHPQPVPPTYEPELCARFIVEVAIDGRRSKVVGSWNKMLVAAGSLFPGFADQYAALAAWDGQLSDRPISPARRVNLWEPVDNSRDFGAHGTFDARARGFWTPRFLRSLPGTAMTFARALGRTTANRRRQPRADLTPSSARNTATVVKP